MPETVPQGESWAKLDEVARWANWVGLSGILAAGKKDLRRCNACSEPGEINEHARHGKEKERRDEMIQ